MLIHWQATYNTAGKKHVECYAFVSRTIFDIFSFFFSFLLLIYVTFIGKEVFRAIPQFDFLIAMFGS